MMPLSAVVQRRVEVLNWNHKAPLIAPYCNTKVSVSSQKIWLLMLRPYKLLNTFSDSPPSCLNTVTTQLKPTFLVQFFFTGL